MKKKVFRPADWVVIVSVLAIAIGLFFWFRPAGSAASATISVDGQVVSQISLPCFNTVTLDNGVTIRFDGMRACIESSDCPDHTCVKNGWLDQAGQSSICLPNRTVLKLDGGNLIIGG